MFQILSSFAPVVDDELLRRRRCGVWLELELVSQMWGFVDVGCRRCGAGVVDVGVGGRGQVRVRLEYLLFPW